MQIIYQIMRKPSPFHSELTLPMDSLVRLKAHVGSSKGMGYAFIGSISVSKQPLFRNQVYLLHVPQISSRPSDQAQVDSPDQAYGTTNQLSVLERNYSEL